MQRFYEEVPYVFRSDADGNIMEYVRANAGNHLKLVGHERATP